MQTLTYGYRKPETGDRAKGAGGWMESIAYDIERLNDHDHDGINSPLLPIDSFSPYTNSILAAGWVADGSGYYQDITVPTGLTELNNYNVKFIFTAPGAKVGEVAYLDYDRLTATTYRVYSNDNTSAFTVLYR
jgi:hypothetical protein